MPKEEGVHHLHAKFNGVHIPGSPFKIVVGSINSNNDPSTVGVFGRGKGIHYSLSNKPSCPLLEDTFVYLVYLY